MWPDYIGSVPPTGIIPSLVSSSGHLPDAAAVTGPEIERLIQLLAKLPGLGPRSARRAALHLIKKQATSCCVPLAEAMDVAVEKVVVCSTCGNIDTIDPCIDLLRPAPRPGDRSSWSRMWPTCGRWSAPAPLNARYHVLGGALSPLDGVGPDDLRIDKLVRRGSRPAAIREVILAVNATVEGQTTAHYIMDRLAGLAGEGLAPRPRRAGRRRARLSRRGDAGRGAPPAHAVLNAHAGLARDSRVA